MPTPSFAHLKVRDAGQVAIAELVDADIVYASSVVQDIGNELLSLLKEHGFTKLILDFHKVQYISSSMIGQLAKLQKEVDAIKGKLGLVGLGPTLQDILKIGHFDRIFAIYDSEDSALKAVS